MHLERLADLLSSEFSIYLVVLSCQNRPKPPFLVTYLFLWALDFHLSAILAQCFLGIFTGKSKTFLTRLVYSTTLLLVFYSPNNAEHRENVRALPPDTRDWGKLGSPRHYHSGKSIEVLREFEDSVSAPIAQYAVWRQGSRSTSTRGTQPMQS